MKKQSTLGILIIIAGVIVLLSNINAGSFRSVLEDWWPLAIITVGLYMLWSNVRSYVWPLIVITIGFLLLLDIKIGLFIVPLVLMGIGLSILSNSLSSKRKNIQSVDEDSIAAILGGSTTKNTSDDYSGGVVTAFMGGVDLDISKTTINKDAVLKVTLVMGGLDLRVPDNVKIINRTQSLMGGVEDKSSPIGSKSAPTLVIEGLILMGGIDIKR